MAYKVFTNGSTLQASEVNDNLMKQAVATFSNSAARTAAITAPVEGQMTYLEDTNLYSMWNGTAWVSPFGMTLLANVVFSAATAVNVDNVFTSSFLNYKIVFQHLQTAPAGQIRFRLRNGGSNITASNYNYQGTRVTNSTVANVSGVNQPEWISQGVSGGDNYFTNIDVYNPATTALTGIYYQGFAFESPGFASWSVGGHERQNLTRDGFTVYATGGTMTGTMKVYGLKDAF